MINLVLLKKQILLTMGVFATLIGLSGCVDHKKYIDERTLEETTAVVDNETEETTQIEETTVIEETETVDPKDDNYYMEKYAPVIEEYKSWIYGTGSDNYVYVDPNMPPDKSNRYGFIDINGNGSKEMITSSGEYINMIYTLDNEAPTLVAVSGVRIWIEILDGGYIFQSSHSYKSYYYDIYQLDNNDKLVNVSSAIKEYSGNNTNGVDIFEYKVNDTDVSESEFDTFCQEYAIDEKGVSARGTDPMYLGTNEF